MAILHPFKAWRPTQDTIYEIACVPYDVIDTDEARVLAAGKPNSFLHVIRPEIDLEETIDVHADSVYEQGKKNLEKILSSGLMTQENEASVYVYRLIMDGREQTGIFSVFDKGSSFDRLFPNQDFLPGLLKSSCNLKVIGIPCRANSTEGVSNFDQSIEPRRWCANSKPATVPGTPTALILK